MVKHIKDYSWNEIVAVTDAKEKRQLLKLYKMYFVTKISHVASNINVSSLKVNEDMTLKEIEKIVQDFVTKKGKK